MKARSILAVLLVMVSAALYSGCSEQRVVEKPPRRVGIVSPSKSYEEVVLGFMTALRRHGPAEMDDVVFLYNGPVLGPWDMDLALARLLKQDVKLIFAVSYPVASRAKTQTLKNHVPVVFSAYDPVRSGLVRAVGLHDCNLTGVQSVGGAGKALHWLLRLKPGVKTILVPDDRESVSSDLWIADLREGARSLGLRLEVVEVKDRRELEEALERGAAGADALWVQGTQLLSSNLDLYEAASLKYAIPLLAGDLRFRSRVHLAFGQDPFKSGELAGDLAFKVLEGATPASLPIETAEYALSLNLQRAAWIGLQVPEGMLKHADYIIR